MDDRCDVLCLDLQKAERLRKQRPSITDAQQMADRAKALADPTRLAIALTLCQADELCVCDLAWIMERSQNLVSHHVRVLREAGLVHSRRDGKMVLCALTDEAQNLISAIAQAKQYTRT